MAVATHLCFCKISDQTTAIWDLHKVNCQSWRICVQVGSKKGGWPGGQDTSEKFGAFSFEGVDLPDHQDLIWWLDLMNWFDELIDACSLLFRLMLFSPTSSEKFGASIFVQKKKALFWSQKTHCILLMEKIGESTTSGFDFMIDKFFIQKNVWRSFQSKISGQQKIVLERKGCCSSLLKPGTRSNHFWVGPCGLPSFCSSFRFLATKIQTTKLIFCWPKNLLISCTGSPNPSHILGASWWVFCWKKTTNCHSSQKRCQKKGFLDVTRNPMNCSVSTSNGKLFTPPEI